MAHELEINAEGKASFAYRLEGGIPWHRLGVPMEGYQLAGDMLHAAYADYEVELVPTYVKDPRTGEFIVVPRNFATTRVNPHNDQYQIIHAGHKSRYTVMQNEVCLQAALDIVDASDVACLDALGVLHDGAVFFATISLDPLILDPEGVDDKIMRFLVVRSSHDGSVPLTFSNTDIRGVCENTVILGEQTAQRVFRTKHTPNIESRLAVAKTVLGISTAWAKSFEATAKEMLSIKITEDKWERVLDAILPVADADTDRKRANRLETTTLMGALLKSDKNAGKVGMNGWAAWNAIVEFYDHHREGTADERAIASMDDMSWVTRKKETAQRAVLALA